MRFCVALPRRHAMKETPQTKAFIFWSGCIIGWRGYGCRCNIVTVVVASMWRACRMTDDHSCGLLLADTRPTRVKRRGRRRWRRRWRSPQTFISARSTGVHVTMTNHNFVSVRAVPTPRQDGRHGRTARRGKGKPSRVPSLKAEVHKGNNAVHDLSLIHISEPTRPY